MKMVGPSCDTGIVIEETCAGCIECQKCNSCQLCNEGCNSAAGNCNSAQTFCVVESQVIGEVSSFTFSPEPKKNVIMGPDDGLFNKDSWDGIIEYMN